MPTIDGNVTFISRINFMKSFITLGPDCDDKGFTRL